MTVYAIRDLIRADTTPRGAYTEKQIFFQKSYVVYVCSNRDAQVYAWSCKSRAIVFRRVFSSRLTARRGLVSRGLDFWWWRAAIRLYPMHVVTRSRVECRTDSLIFGLTKGSSRITFILFLSNKLRDRYSFITYQLSIFNRVFKDLIGSYQIYDIKQISHWSFFILSLSFSHWGYWTVAFIYALTFF